MPRVAIGLAHARATRRGGPLVNVQSESIYLMTRNLTGGEVPKFAIAPLWLQIS